MDLDKTGDFYRSRCAITIPGMKKAGTIAQFFACFTYLEDYRTGNGYEDAYLHVQEMIDYFKRQMELGKEDIAYAGSFQELETNEILAAGLDVLSEEPMRTDNPLRGFTDSNRLLITPHIAWASIEARTKLMNIIAGQIKEFFGL